MVEWCITHRLNGNIYWNVLANYLYVNVKQRNGKLFSFAFQNHTCCARCTQPCHVYTFFFIDLWISLVFSNILMIYLIAKLLLRRALSQTDYRLYSTFCLCSVHVHNGKSRNGMKLSMDRNKFSSDKVPVNITEIQFRNLFINFCENRLISSRIQCMHSSW